MKAIEEAALRAVRDCGEDAYGNTIRDAMNRILRVNLTFGRMYEILDSLEVSGFLTSHWGEAKKTRGGRRPQYFTLTSQGLDEINRITPTDEPQIELHANYRWEFANFTTSPASERRRLHSDNHGAAREADEALRREYRLTVLTLVVFGLLTFGGCFALLSTIARQKAANELTAPGFRADVAPVRTLAGRREAGRP